MATTIRELLVRLGVKADTVAVKAFSRSVDVTKRGLLAATAATVGLVVGLAAVTAGTAAAGDEVDKISKRLGITSDEFQELSFAAGRSGASTKQLEVAFKTLNKTFSDARRIGGEVAASYAAIGFSDLSKLSDDSVTRFGQVAEGIRNLDSAADQSAVADKIFGGGGVKLLPLLKEGQLGIDALRAEARRLGIVLDGEAVEASAKFQDSLLGAQLTFKAIRDEIGVAFLPVFNEMLDAFTESAVVIRPFLKTFLTFLDRTVGLRNALFALVAIAGALTAALGGLSVLALIGAAIPAISAFAAAVAAVTSALGIGLIPLVLLIGAAIVSLAISLSPAIAAIAILGLVIEDLVVYFQGGNSAIGEFIDTFINLPGVIGASLRFLRSLGDLFGSLANLGLVLAGVAQRSLPGALTVLGGALESLDAITGGILTKFLEVTGLGEALSGFFKDTGAEIDRATSFLDLMVVAVDAVALAFSSLTIDFEGLAAKIPSIPSLIGLPGGAAAPATNGGNTTSVNVDGGGFNINTGASPSEVQGAVTNALGGLFQQAQDAVYSTEE